MTAAALILVALAAFFAGKHRGRGEGFAQGWLCAWYLRAGRR